MTGKARVGLIVAAVLMLVVGAAGVLVAVRRPAPTPRVIALSVNAPGLSAPEIERQITIPLENSLIVPGVARSESVSAAGHAELRLTLAPKAVEAQVRSDVLERAISAQLPPLTSPSLLPAHGPTVLRYVLVAQPSTSALELADAQEWELSRALLQTPGVVDVVSCGARLAQVQVVVDAARARALSTTGQDVVRAMELSSSSFPGRPAQKTLAELGALPVGEREGVPILVRDVATIALAPEPERCVARHEGTSVVLVDVFLLRDANLDAVTTRVQKVLSDAEGGGRVRALRVGFAGAPARTLVRVRAPEGTTDAAVLAALATAGKTDIVTRRAQGEDLELLIPVASGDRAGEHAAIAAALATLPGVGWEIPEATRPSEVGLLRARLRGADRDALASAAGAAAAIWRAEPSLHGVFVTSDATSPEVTIVPDRTKLALFGMQPGDVSIAIELTVGHVSGAFYEGERRRDIVVRTKIDGVEAASPSRELLAAILVPSTNLGRVPVSDVATVEERRPPRVLLRDDHLPAVDVLVSPAGPTAGRDARAKLVAGLALPAGVTLTFGPESL